MVYFIGDEGNISSRHGLSMAEIPEVSIQFHLRGVFLSFVSLELCYLQEVELDRSLAAEDGDEDFHFSLRLINRVNRA